MRAFRVTEMGRGNAPFYVKTTDSEMAAIFAVRSPVFNLSRLPASLIVEMEYTGRFFEVATYQVDISGGVSLICRPEDVTVVSVEGQEFLQVGESIVAERKEKRND